MNARKKKKKIPLRAASDTQPSAPDVELRNGSFGTRQRPPSAGGGQLVMGHVLRFFSSAIPEPPLLAPARHSSAASTPLASNWHRTENCAHDCAIIHSPSLLHSVAGGTALSGTMHTSFPSLPLPALLPPRAEVLAAREYPHSLAPGCPEVSALRRFASFFAFRFFFLVPMPCILSISSSKSSYKLLNLAAACCLRRTVVLFSFFSRGHPIFLGDIRSEKM